MVKPLSKEELEYKAKMIEELKRVTKMLEDTPNDAEVSEPFAFLTFAEDGVKNDNHIKCWMLFNLKDAAMIHGALLRAADATAQKANSEYLDMMFQRAILNLMDPLGRKN
jgi:hypothetical protein